jgi:DNA-binding NarL/FixJ family response regulator
MTVRCLLVDDNDRFLESARALLQSDGIEVAGVATASAQAIQRAEQLRPDVTLVDIALGQEFGFDLAYALTRRITNPPLVIMTSTYPETDFTDLIADSPAIGFVPKTELSGSAIRALISDADTAN